jgi:hypothetical protein
MSQQMVRPGSSLIESGTDQVQKRKKYDPMAIEK